MTTEIKRDLLADLAICETTTPYWRDRNGDLMTVPEARDGWTYAIRRALAAEAEVESLRLQRDALEATLQHYRGYA